MEQVSTPNRAGIFQGEQHSETGIPLALIDTGSRIEVEGGEFNFPEWVQTDKKIYTISGTNYKVIQQLFKLIGAEWDNKVTHVKSGDIIICIRSAFDDEVRTYTGTLIQIISAINESRGCKHVQSGATMTNHETGATVQMKNGGRISPNGKLSNLNEMQWHLVRTPEFKKWFGDWEKAYTTEDYTGVSMALDENKEPLVLYHGTTKDFNVFDISKATKNTQVDWGNLGFFFTPDESLALDFTRYKWAKSEKSKIKKGSKIIPVFLNIKLPHYITARQFSMYHEKIDKAFREKQMQEYDGWIITKFSQEDKQSWIRLWGGEGIKEFLNDQYVVFESNQIKLADGTNTTFDASNPDIRKIDGGQLPELNDEGGYEYKDKDEKIADRCGLITLPKSITGTNCSNCIFQKDGFCDHEKILLPVTKRMCCAMWSDKSLGSIISNITKADFFPDKKLKEKEYPLNENGGYDYIGSGLKRAKAVDLITLPKNIEGTNCAYRNCKYTDENNFCTHPKIMLPVTDRMSCGWYDADGIIRPWGKPVEIDFSKEKKNGGALNSEATWILADTILEVPELLALKNGGRIAQGYIMAPYSKLKGIFGEPNVKNEKEKIGWYMAIDKNHTGAIWTEADKSVKTIMKEKFHKWFVWGANDESQKRLYEATHSQVRDIDPEKQKAKDKAISVKRWVKKRKHIQEMANGVHRIKLNVSRDLNSEDEKEFLTALVVGIMLQTSERVGNEESSKNGHCGVTGFKKENVSVIGNKVLLDYTGKSGVEHEKSFTDKKLAKAVKKAIKNSPSKYVFETSDGFRIKCDKVNRYLENFSVTAKNIRGFNANKGIIKKLEAVQIPEEQKQRKKVFLSALKKTAREVGHGASTLKSHYMIPELMDEYVLHSRIIDMKKLGYYDKGGEVEPVGSQQSAISNEPPYDRDFHFHFIGENTEGKPPMKIPTTSCFFNPVAIPDAVKLAGEKLDEEAASKNIDMKDVFRSYPVKEISFKDVVPMQEDLYAHKLEEFIASTADNNNVFPIPSAIEHEGKYYINDGHHRTVAFHINGKPILAHVYSIENPQLIEGGDDFYSDEIKKDSINFLNSSSNPIWKAVALAKYNDLSIREATFLNNLFSDLNKLKKTKEGEYYIEIDAKRYNRILMDLEKRGYGYIIGDSFTAKDKLFEFTHAVRMFSEKKDTGGVADADKQKEAERMAKEFIAGLSAEDLKSLKQEFTQALDRVIIDEEKILSDIQQKKTDLDKEREALYAKEKTLEYGVEKNDSFTRRMKISQEIEVLINPQLIHQENIVKAIKNGGDIASFTDKKGTKHSRIPSFVKINTDLITFGEDTILTDAVPPYIPLINEQVFRGKGFVFDAIRIASDEYLVAVNGYKEKRSSGYDYRAGEFVGHPEDSEQGYVLTTLDQLALINDYYFVKEKATLQKEANEKNIQYEKSYDRMAPERRKVYLVYGNLPARNKKDITKEEYEKLSIEEREKIYKPFQRAGVKRLKSKLEENQMWVSYHNMYERFINPEAVSPKQGYANEEVFTYWRKFRQMMEWKIKDIKVQREAESEIRKIALETSFGESNTNDSLKEKYGILVKRQNGTKIMPAEIDQIRKSWEKLNKTFGTMANNARTVNLKISHTGLKYVFASKSAGIFIPSMKTIAVSNKFGDDQFEGIFAHETAHWIDYSIGQLKGKRYATDDFESTAGLIADTLRQNMNEASDSDYVNATKECFARAMEQYFAFENFGEEATLIYSGTALDEVRTYHSEDKYVSKEVFNTKLKPLIQKFLAENSEWFQFGIEPEKKLFGGAIGKKNYTGDIFWNDMMKRDIFEIVDKNVTINFIELFSSNPTHYLYQLIRHVELFKIYPFLRSVIVNRFDISDYPTKIKDEIAGTFEYRKSQKENILIINIYVSKTIFNTGRTPDGLSRPDFLPLLQRIRKIFIHEIQHAIQYHEYGTCGRGYQEILESVRLEAIENPDLTKDKSEETIAQERYEAGFYERQSRLAANRIELDSKDRKAQKPTAIMHNGGQHNKNTTMKNAGTIPSNKTEKWMGFDVNKSKYDEGDMVYSWQNKDYPAEIARKHFGAWTSPNEPHENDRWKYVVKLKDGNRSKWMDESSLFKTKQDKYIDGGSSYASGGEIIKGKSMTFGELKKKLEPLKDGSTNFYYNKTNKVGGQPKWIRVRIASIKDNEIELWDDVNKKIYSLYDYQFNNYSDPYLKFSPQMHNGGGAGITREEYHQLLSYYDKLTGQYEDLEDQQNETLKAELTKQIEETERKINAYENADENSNENVTTIIISSSAPLSTALQALTGSHWTMQSFEGTSEDFTEIATGRKFKSYTLEKAKEQGITGIMIPSEGTIYNFYLKADEQGAHKTAMEYINNNLLTPELVDDLLQGYATGMPYDEKHKLIVSLNKLPETEFGGAMEKAGQISVEQIGLRAEQIGQKLSMHIGNQTMWVERRPDNSQPNPYDGLNYFIYSSPLAQFAFMGAQTWAAFVHSVSRIASGVLDDMINADRLHYEKNK